MVRVRDAAELQVYVDRVNQPAKAPVVMNHVPTTEEILGLQLQEAGISYTPQYHFNPSNQNQRVDFGILRPDDLAGKPFLLIEVDGNGTKGHTGAHRSVKGYEADRERDFEMLMLGFTVLRVTTRQVMRGRAIIWIQELVKKAGA